MTQPPPKRTGVASLLRNPRLQWLALILYTALLTVTSLVPSGRLPTIPDWSDLFSPDKVAHFGAYAILAVLLSLRLYPRYAGRGILAAILIAACIGALLEVLQGLTGLGRQADYVDMVANLLGATIGGLLFAGSYKLYKSAFPTGRAL